MDGVVFQGGNFWLDLHNALGTAEEGVALAHQHLSSDYGELARQVVGRLWRGKPARAYLDLVQRRKYQPHLRELHGLLKRNGLTTLIVSSGPLPLALRAQRELGFDRVLANDLLIERGVFTGEADIRVPDAHKLEAASDLLAELGLVFEQCVSIGDSRNDAAIARRVAHSFAFNTEAQELLASASEHVPTLRRVGVRLIELGICSPDGKQAKPSRAGGLALRAGTLARGVFGDEAARARIARA
ncbi:MAG: HAD-IB family phosphatase [Planctomycetota bacterium]|nr:HAD-IB family phosphatase [Planctomycetota bacterium]